MAEQKLDLLEFPAGSVTKTRARATTMPHAA
jgi:hypothetical protein